MKECPKKNGKEECCLLMTQHIAMEGNELVSPHLTCTSWPVVMHNKLEHHVVLDGFASTHLGFENNINILEMQFMKPPGGQLDII